MRFTIHNPILTKEVISTLRSRKALLLSLTFIVVLSFLVIAMWPAEGISPDSAHRARAIFSTVVVAQLAMLLLFAPSFASTCITSEKDSNTYESLYCTDLTATAIVLGKLGGATGFLVLLIMLSLPIGALSMALGGVNLGEFFTAYVILVASAGLFGLLGVTFSALMRRSFGSLIVTYIALIVICGVVQIPPLLLPGWRGGQTWLHRVRCISPFSALMALTQNVFRSRGAGATAEALAWFFGFLIVAFLILLLLAILGARRSAARPPRRRRAAIGDETPLSRRMLRRTFFLVDARRRRRPISLLVNPIFVLEFRNRIMSKSNMLRTFFAWIIVSMGSVIMVAGTWGAASIDTVRLIAISMQFGLVVLLTPSLTVGAISSEIENRTIDQLRMTPIGPLRILLGKLAAAFGYALMLLVAIIPVFLAIMFIRQNFNLDQLLAVVSVTSATIALAITAGMFFSSICRRTAVAAAFTYGLMGVMVVASAMAAIISERLHPALTKATLAVNPVICVVAAMSEQMFDRYSALWKTNSLILAVLSGAAIIGCYIQLRLLVEPTD